MAGSIITIVLGQPLVTNYQGQVFVTPYVTGDSSYGPEQFVSWIWISIDEVIAPGNYDIPSDQQDNLDWFYANNFRLDKFGRRHIQYAMTDYTPVQVTVI